MLSDNQRSLLKSIQNFIDKNGYSPTVRELMEIEKTSSSSVVYYRLMVLKERGYITFEQNKSRTIKVIKW